VATNKTSPAERLDSSPRWPILHALKRSSGLCIADLAATVGLSYMGTKQHCLALEKNGYVISRKDHRELGRPRLLYGLTPMGHLCFHPEDTTFALSMMRQAQQLFGPGAGGKMLFLHYQEKAESYAKALSEITELSARLAKLADLRDADGCMASLDGATIVERHCPWEQIFLAFPEAASLEEACLSKALGVPLKRSVVGTGAAKVVRLVCLEH